MGSRHRRWRHCLRGRLNGRQCVCRHRCRRGLGRDHSRQHAGGDRCGDVGLRPWQSRGDRRLYGCGHVGRRRWRVATGSYPQDGCQEGSSVECSQWIIAQMSRPIALIPLHAPSYRPVVRQSVLPIPKRLLQCRVAQYHSQDITFEAAVMARRVLGQGFWNPWPGAQLQAEDGGHGHV